MANETEIARCPACTRPVFADHPYAWCQECGEPLPEQIRALIPSQQWSATAPPSAGRAVSERTQADAVPYKSPERFALANPGVLTLVIMGICFVIAPLTLSLDPEITWARQYAWGAQINEEVNAGEWWRLLSAAFLHGGWGHLIGNMYALFVVGSVVERAFGRAEFFTIYVLAALGGSAATFIFLDGSSVGASGAIFGLFGAAMSLLPRQEERAALPLSESQLGGLGWWAAYSLLRGFTDPHINNAAHIGGLVTGALVATVLPSVRVTSTLTTVCATLVALTGLRMGLSSREVPRVTAYVRAIDASRRSDTTAVRLELDRAVPFPKALEWRAGLRLEHGDYKGALHDADALLATHRRGESRRMAHYVRAAALFQLGATAQALADLQPALKSRNAKVRQAVRQLKLEIERSFPEGGLPASVRNLRSEPAAAAPH
jgi:membrane associated rhomboid family serine protease